MSAATAALASSSSASAASGARPGSSSAAGSSSSPSSLYALASRVPLIKSPTLRIPSIPTLPVDLHPLPPALEPYFVYNFSLEEYVLRPAPAGGPAPSSSSGGGGEGGALAPRLGPAAQRRTLRSTQEAATAYLAERARAAKQKQEDQLRQLAPGWRPDGPGLLIPSRKSTEKEKVAQALDTPLSGGNADAAHSQSPKAHGAGGEQDEIAAMLDQLELMDSKRDKK